MRIGVDVMGGDHAPSAILEGALASIDHFIETDQLVLVGDEAVIGAGIDAAGLAGDPRLEVVATTQVIGMSESPVDAVRGKPDSSIAVLARLCGRRAKNPLDATLSAGNTGAKVTAAQMFMRRLKGVHRPGIAVAIPTFAGQVTLIDVGANIEPKPIHLAQYGVMGAIYSEKFLGIAKPRVGLMNVGTEEAKGTSASKEVRDHLAGMPGLNFIGNVEGRGVFEGEADVVVTDGVVGNVMIKLAEGLSAGIFRALGAELKKMDPELAVRLEKVIRTLYSKHDYHEHGAAPLLGVNGGCLICHGSSESRTITNAIVRARQFVESGINEAITERLSAMEETTA
ncbi:MAG: phosphate acyltransferase PlsX [Planctomycetota bacterium]|jgi:glycerol-3-phosphate acyltransferase PlsX